jgi:hypothetical protein
MRSTLCWKLFFCFAFLPFVVAIANIEAKAQGCNCQANCPLIPNPPNIAYTNCYSAFTQVRTILVTVPLPTIPTTVDVEVTMCCRIRYGANCQPYVTAPIGASCETAITCIRVSKAGLLNYAPVGGPLISTLRGDLLKGVLKGVICANPCEHGLPGVGENPYEWVFSIPQCLVCNKTNNEYWCLTPCGPKYCVYAFKMARSASNQPRVIEYVKTTFQYNNGPCGTEQDNCTNEGCFPEFDPECDNWERADG